MPRSWLYTTAPNGSTWERYLRGQRPVLDNQGLVAGAWGEAMHHAVMFEVTNTGWTDGPAGQVIDFAAECGHGSLGPALERTEEAAKERMRQGDYTFAFQQQAFPAGIPMGQPVQEGVQQGVAVPHHPGAPGMPVVVGIPISQRAEQAIAAGNLPEKANPQFITVGASILDESRFLPDRRPWRDVPFAVCFVLVVIAMLGLMVAFVGEIPKFFTRVGTEYKTYPGDSCGLVPITKWENGDPTAVSGINQRLQNTTTSARRLASVWEDTAIREGPVVEFPGLSSFTRKLEAMGVPVEAEDDDELLEAPPAAADGRRLSTTRRKSAPKVVDRDCERACSAFEECVAFDVTVSMSGTKCIYQKKPSSGTMPAPVPSTTPCSGVRSPCTACWRKVNTSVLSKASAGILGLLFLVMFVGAVFSMFAACGFVKLASVQPAAATYCGVYFVPGCMIFVGFVLAAALFPILAMSGVVLGAAFMCMGTCLCGCTWFCYRDLIPLTIEVIATVTSVVMRYMSMLVIAACGAIFSMLWSFVCLTAFIGVYAYTDRVSATTPASQAQPVQVGYVQYFFECLIYGWAGYVIFNTCHVAFCGVFGRWYFGKDGKGTVASSLKVALTTSFGSICLGSLVIATIRAMEQVARKMQRDAAEDGNVVGQIVACVMQCIIGCIGDILEWISQYVYVQVALRGLGFMDAAKAIYALATISNLIYVVSAMMCDWVVGMGACLCALCGGAVAAALGYVTCTIPSFAVPMALIAGMLGFFAGCCAGGSAVGVISSGATTILTCWAENPDVLQRTYPHIHERFQLAISKGESR